MLPPDIHWHSTPLICFHIPRLRHSPQFFSVTTSIPWVNQSGDKQYVHPRLLHLYVLFPYLFKLILQLLGLIISPPPVVQTLAGISTDIHHVVGNVAFDCFSSTHSRFEEVGGSSFMMHCRNVDGTNSSIQSALKIFRVGPTDHSQMDRVNNVRYMFPQILLLRLVVDTLCS